MFRQLKLATQFAWARFRTNRYPSFYSSHSQFGEDMILRACFGHQSTGFYVDLGAHHPFYYSNTFHFYRKGWRGLNVDALPGSMAPFRLLRSRDINIEACLGPQDNGQVTYFMFEDSALNTLDEKLAEKILAENRSQLVRKMNLTTRSLVSLFEEHLPQGQSIDFLSIDIEGLDELLLRSNNWARFRPRALVFESHHSNNARLGETPLVQFLESQGYKVFGVSGPSIIMSI